MEEYKEIERSIIKKFRKDIWSKFVKAVADYELISPNDNAWTLIEKRNIIIKKILYINLFLILSPILYKNYITYYVFLLFMLK